MRPEQNFEGKTIKTISRIGCNLSMCQRLDGKRWTAIKRRPGMSKLFLERQRRDKIKEPFKETPCDE